MDEYIKREALSDHVMAYGRPISCCVVTEQRGVLFEIGNWVCDGKIYFVIKADGKVGECREISAKESAADVVEVRHGEWVESFSHGVWHYDCPFCGDGYATKERQEKPENYCSNCGARMDGGSK